MHGWIRAEFVRVYGQGAMKRALFTLLVCNACWTGSTEIHTTPIIHVRAVRPPAPEPDTCQLSLDDLWRFVEAGQPNTDDGCDPAGPQDDYWFCAWGQASQVDTEVLASAFIAVLACSRSTR